RGRGVPPRHARGLGVRDDAAAGGRDPMSRMRRVADIAVLLVLAVYAIPFFWQLLTSFKPDPLLLQVSPLVPTELTTLHYQVVWSRSVIPRALGNSLAVAALTTGLALVLGLFAPYALPRLPVPGPIALLLCL